MFKSLFLGYADEDVTRDLEIQMFRDELTSERDWAPGSGCGMQVFNF